jgi:hypothetical protein
MDDGCVAADLIGESLARDQGITFSANDVGEQCPQLDEERTHLRVLWHPVPIRSEAVTSRRLVNLRKESS